VSFTDLIEDVLSFSKIIFTDSVLTTFNSIELSKSYRILNYFLSLVEYPDAPVSIYILKKRLKSYLERALFINTFYKSNIKLSIIVSSDSEESVESYVIW
jgi:hypothetical protein